MTDSQWPVWQVFERPAHGHPVRAAGSVHAVDAETALQNAWAVYGRRPTAVALWVVPRSLVGDQEQGRLWERRADARGSGGGDRGEVLRLLPVRHQDRLRRSVVRASPRVQSKRWHGL